MGEGVCQGGGHGEQAEQQVRDGQVDQEDVARGPHHLGGQPLKCEDNNLETIPRWKERSSIIPE